jgi:LuxR family transcriptional activator of conjugal transfer of Ti plasmids
MAGVSSGLSGHSPPLVNSDQAALAFFQDAIRVTTLAELTESFSRAAEAAGFSMGTCYHVATPGQPVAMRYLFGWNMSGWGAHYAEARLSRYDPAVQSVFTSPQAFTWLDVEQRTSNKAALGVFDQARTFGAIGGLVVPIHGPLGEVMAVTLISEHHREIDPQTRMNMQVAATIFASRGLALAEIEREASPDPGLSRREIQCVFWINEGKTDWEIGVILGISEDTVAFHLKNVKAKLGVARRSQIPISAWLRGVLLDERPS